MNRYVETNLKTFRPVIDQIRRLDFFSYSDSQIREKASSLRQTVLERHVRTKDPAGGDYLDQLMPEAFSLVCAAVRKEFGWTVFDSQLLGAAAMQSGRVIELDTGEGKTLVAVFVAFLRALTGQGVHVLTFNDYLAQRDALWMGPVYDRLGIKATAVQQGMTLPRRREAYLADVTYLTAKEAGFDYLRGFLAASPDDLVQRPFHFAVVDEADSILIDEARIPLVLAGGEGGPGAIDPALYKLVRQLQKNRHFYLDTYGEHVLLTESGVTWLEKHLNVANLYDPGHIELLAQIYLILQASELLKRDVDYIVRQGSIQLVDELTGRVIFDRQWPDGLHEAVEIKEGLAGRTRGRILDRITLRDFLSLYPGMCGMTGTAWSAASEMHHFYGLQVTRIPPHVPSRRIDQPDLIYACRDTKEAAIAEEIASRNRAGQPVLVGTASVEESERLAALMWQKGLACSVLNAREDAAEAAVIAKAGRRGAVTISTNMAGRGVDIRIEDPEGPGLYVIGTSRQRSLRIDNQLRGRAGRQGDPGESRFYISLEDDLIERYRIREALPAQYANLAVLPAQPIQDPAVRTAVEHTQRVLEGQLFQQRQALARYSLLIEEQRRRIHQLHEDVLTHKKVLTVWQDQEDDVIQARLAEIGQAVPEGELQQTEQLAGALLISRGWADYLELVEQLLDHVSLMRTGPSDPFTTFNKQIIDAFTHFLDVFESDMIELAGRLIVKDGRISLPDSGLAAPPSTRTYLIEDGSDSLEQTLGISDLVAAAANPAGLFLTLLSRWRGRSGS